MKLYYLLFTTLMDSCVESEEAQNKSTIIEGDFEFINCSFSLKWNC
jgi:hypothetical protein